METSNDIGTMKYRKVYDAILQNSKDGYLVQDVSMHFSYETNQYYDDNVNKISQLNGFGDINAGTELQTLINATNWVSHILMSNKEPTIDNIPGYDIIDNVRKGIYGANCYAHAVVLNDVFHLLGYKCRYIFCEPIDFHFRDNHVVNLVLSKNTHKWLLFDAAQGVYFTKKSGEVMSIQDLRDHIIANEQFEVNLLDEYWSGISERDRLMAKNRIIVYMTKNLYRFGCWQNSFLNRIATEGVVTYYELIPKSYMQTPFIQSQYSRTTGIKTISIYGSDEAEFWKKPEV